MYRSSLSKKLKPAKRAWKSFTSNLQSKLQSLNVPKTLKTTTHRFINFCSLHLFIPFKKRFLTRTTHRRSRYNHLYRQYYQQYRRDFEAIFIDNLYSEPISSSSAHAKTTDHAHNAAETSSRGKEAAAHEKSNNKQSVYSVEDAWNAVVASSPQLRCVDERADEFIYKFREDMKIQRERSLLEYQEMLARGA
ncbi:cotton fiber protein [Citrus sinensis]|uniref:uncharacterized protein LOC102607497 n=1 Tax=Citrus sinensis TaxID=2711 RepID=UPI00219C8E2C|nr:uncharacterized protein LOC102607497 [Citrus sinensis]KAH9764396.1 cotton fiber protein [Citrus sinensis]